MDSKGTDTQNWGQGMGSSGDGSEDAASTSQPVAVVQGGQLPERKAALAVGMAFHSLVTDHVPTSDLGRQNLCCSQSMAVH